MSSFGGKRAFVTGGSSGIGAAIARLLAARGAEVVFSALDATDAAPFAREIGARVVELDVTSVDATRKAVIDSGPISILVNNVGMDQHAFFTQTNEAEWRTLLAVNLEAVFATTHAALPAMQAAGYGRIVNIASEAARLGSRGGAVYSAAKGGVISFTRSIARENARKGITANVVTPGPIDTPMLRSAVERGGAEAARGDERRDPGRSTGPAGRGRVRGRVFSPRTRRRTSPVNAWGVSGGMACGA